MDKVNSHVELSIWHLFKAETEYRKECGISAVYLHKFDSIATTYGLQYQGLMYIIYITQQIGVDVKYNIAQSGKNKVQ